MSGGADGRRESEAAAGEEVGAFERILAAARRGERIDTLLGALPDGDRAEILDVLEGEDWFLGPVAAATHPLPRAEPYPAESAAGVSVEGRRIGPYRLLRELGRGGQGVVHLALDTRLHRKVALKILGGPSSLALEAVNRFRREAELASRLDHPGICAIYDVGIDDGVPYIAMRHVDGRSLEVRIEEARRAAGLDGPDENGRHGVDPAAASPFPDPGETAALIAKAARALHAAHEAGIVHRDVKPANIIVGPDGEPVLTDFGLAREVEGGRTTLTRTGAIFGTPAYLSPEQLGRGRIAPDRRTDIYSLAVTLFECLTLTRPFEAPTRDGLYDAILTKEPSDPRRLNPRVPRDLRTVLAVAMDKDVDRRYQTALAFAEDLDRARRQLPIRVHAIGPVGRAARWARRNPASASLTLGLFLALGAGLLLTRIEKARADENAAVAERRARLIEEQAAELRILADRGEAARLVEEADLVLWPAAPSRIPDFERWLARAREILARLPDYRRELEDLEARIDSASAETPDRDAGARRELLADLLPRLEALGNAMARTPGLLGIEGRLEFARNVERRSVEESREAWRDAAARVAADARFAGFDLRPQTGLVPLGADVASRLEEFADLQTGVPPVRDGAGRLAVAEGSGLVFVLVPGGRSQLGVQKADPAAPNFDPTARDDELPLFAVALAPFLISKYEMTQGQWERSVGERPSYFSPDRRIERPIGSGAYDLRHPVEYVSWIQCDAVMRRLGLVLPTEAQWEHAARGGTATRWWCGEEPGSLQGAGNVADEGSRKLGAPGNWSFEALDDGFVASAPVGSFRPNPFGLHDVIGNVWEWCRDGYAAYDRVTPRPGDGFREVPDRHDVVGRGGCFNAPAYVCRSSYRERFAPEWRRDIVGVRPSRALTP